MWWGLPRIVPVSPATTATATWCPPSLSRTPIIQRHAFEKNAVCSGLNPRDLPRFPGYLFSDAPAISRILLDSSFCGRVDGELLVKSVPTLESLTFAGPRCKHCIRFPLRLHSAVSIYNGCLGKCTVLVSSVLQCFMQKISS